MDTTQWGQVLAAYQAVADLKPDDRADRLCEVCAGDEDLEREVRSLLDFDSRAGEFLESGGLVRMLDLCDATDDESLFGQTFGEFTIQGVLGRGGMSVVYDAEQANPRRRVALKVLRSGPLTDDVALRLFRREAAALARLDHPGIAVIHGAGSAEQHHYFAMEFVDGQAITDFVRDRELSIRDRLRLFRKVCDAVHYAHQRGVVHRDLKPSNILVLESGEPKVLDFGIARLLDADPGVTVHVTQPGVILGTLAYMSPEQASSRASDIDTRTDVYSLGVILYQLLTGSLPHDLTEHPIPEAVRMVCDETPRAPGAIKRELRGDLETIVLKAIDKRPENRYESVAALAEDIRRFLVNEPILARPPSQVYQLQKLIVRNKVTSLLAGVALLAVTGMATGMSFLYVRANRARAEALTQATTANRVKDFLKGIFDASYPDVAQGEDPKASDLLARGVERIRTELQDEPVVRSELLATLAGVSVGLSDHSTARALYEEAYQLRVAEYGAQDTLAVKYQQKLATILRELDQPEEAIALLRDALAMAESAPNMSEEDLADVIHDLATVVRARDPAEAEQLHRRALDVRRKYLGDKHTAVADSLAGLGVTLRQQERYGPAIECYREALSIQLGAYGEDRIVAANTYTSLAVALQARGSFDDAHTNFLKGLEIYRRLLKTDHTYLVNSLQSIGHMLLTRGQVEESIPYLEEATAMSRRIYGDTHRRVARAARFLGEAYARVGRLDEAEATQRKAIEVYEQVYPDPNREVDGAKHYFALTLMKKGKMQESVELLEGVVERCTAGKPKESCPMEVVDLAKALTAVGRSREAEALCRDVVELFADKDDTFTAYPLQYVIYAGYELGRSLMAQERWQEAKGQLLVTQSHCHDELAYPNLHEIFVERWSRYLADIETALMTIEDELEATE